MIQLINCVLRCQNQAQLGILKNYEALEYAKPEGIRDVFWCNKTPVILASDTCARDIDGYPVIDIPLEIIGNDEAFTDFCHSKGIECGEYRTGEVYDTNEERCFLCEMGRHKGIGDLARYNQFVEEPVDGIFYESRNFFATMEKGPLGEMGFCMIASKKHYLSAAQFPEALKKEYRQVMKDIEKILLKAFNGISVVFWEHGSNPSGLSTHDRAVVHFHLHVLVNWKIEKKYLDRIQMVPCEDISVAKNASYFSYQEGSDGILMISMHPDVYRNRQFARQYLAEKKGLPEGHYNWRYYVDADTTEAALFYIHKTLSQWPEGRIRERTRGFVIGYAKRPKKKETQ